MLRLRNLFFVCIFVYSQSAIAGQLDVMTQNQYLGADLAPVIAAAAADPFDPDAFNQAVVMALQEVAANKTAERLQAQAKSISKRQPHFVGLQEVSVFSCEDPFETGACDDPRIADAFNNHLDLTLAALDGGYEAAAIVENFKVEGVPFFLFPEQTQPALLTLTDRDVILARNDIETNTVDFGCVGFISIDGCNYQVTLPAGAFGNVLRGYVGVDATIGDDAYRIVNTHLEVKDPPIPPFFQDAQALELLTVLGATQSDMTLVVLGDINSSPDDPDSSPYGQFTALGYTDAWTLRPGDKSGNTCCQLADLSNKKSALDQRIDMVFLGMLPQKVKKARVLGNKMSSKTRPPGMGLWASDHGAVAAKLHFTEGN
jgi:endonuclease/exonuclease/phosphatase family metal-dependent hydrolase